MADRRSFLKPAKRIAAWTLLSRVTGLIRDICLNTQFGQTWVQDAFNYGFQIPNLFRRMFGEGALAAVFVPAFTETLDRDGRPAAWSLLARVLARFTATLISVTLAIELVVLAVWLIDPGGSMRRLILALTALMLPFMIGICVVGLLSSILHCLGRFGAPAAMPIVLNLCMIVGILALGPALGESPEARIFGPAIAVLVAGVLQLVLLRPVLRSAGVEVGLQWRRRDSAISPLVLALIPVMLGQGVLLINTFLDTQMCTFLCRAPGASAEFTLFGRSIAYPLEAGALSAVTNAQRLYQFPLGVLAISLATAALPAFSRFAIAGDTDGLREALGRAMRLAVFEGLPCGLILVVLGEPIIRLLFEYGRFTPEHTARAAAVLRWYGLGVWAFCLHHVLLRGFYSMKDTRTPMWIGAALVGVNLLMNLTLIWIPTVREQAFSISTAVTASLNVGISFWLLRRKLARRIGGRAFLATIVKTLGMSLVAAGAAWWIHTAIGDGRLVPGTIINRAISVGAPLLGAMLIYLGLAALAGMQELRWLFGRERADGAM
ncbi:MAG: murein biosynthesis integral membrane protein MurJ [Phycisphaerae bacterium]